MPRDASGNYTLPAGNPVVTATVISSTWANTTLNDIRDTLTDSLSRSGEGGMTAPLAEIDGTALVPSYTFSSEPGLGFYRAAAGVLAASGPLQLSGNVTQPLQAVPLQQLTAYQPTFRNKLINGDFSVWQRNITQTTSGYGSDDRWVNAHVGDLKTASRGTFALGQTAVPGNPKYFSNTIYAANPGAGNFVAKQQRIEGVQTFSGRNVRLSFWAKATAPVPIAMDFAQGFGTGGSPSATVSGIGAQQFNLTTSWQKFTATVAIPSISGKTLGVQNDTLELTFWFSAGATYNSRTASLGQQTGEVQLALVQVEDGTLDTSFEFLPPAMTLMLCQRYLQIISGSSFKGIVVSATSFNRVGGSFPAMRVSPAATLVGFLSVYDGGTVGTITSIASYYIGNATIEFDANAASGGFTIGRPATILNDGAGWILLSAEI
jgi:hypothetical protein